MKSRQLLSATLLVLLFSAHSEEFLPYTVKKDEVLLSILKAHQLQPILGKNGSLKKAITLNPSLKKRKGNLIFPNQEIYLPIINPPRQIPPPEVAETETESSEIIFRETSSEVKSKYFLASLTLSLGTGFLRTEGKDNSNFSGTTDSKNYYLTNLSYRQNWEEIGLTTIIDLGFNSIELSPPPVEKHSKDKFNLASYGAGMEKKLTENGSILGGIHFSPLFYVYSKTAQTVKTDVAQLGALNLGWKQTVLKHKKMSGHLLLNALSTLPQKSSTIEFKNGWGAEVGYQNEYRHNDWGIQGNLMIRKSYIKTNLEDLEQTGFAVSLGYTRYFE